MWAKTPRLEGAFLRLSGPATELEIDTVLQDLAGEVGLGGGEALDEVGGGLALAPVEVALDPVHEDARLQPFSMVLRM